MNILTRYQRYTREGIEWTKWYISKKVESKEDAEKYIKNAPKIINKLKLEYKYDEG